MVSIKLMFRPSANPMKAGTLYFRVIHNRVAKLVKTDCHILPDEWDAKNGRVIKSSAIAANRKMAIEEISFKIQREYAELKRIAKEIERLDVPFETDDLVEMYYKSRTIKVTVFEYADRQIARLNKLGKVRTAECYKASIICFKRFRDGNDLDFEMVDSDMMELYEAYLRDIGVCRNTSSFYLRNLRSIYNKAVKDGLALETKAFRNVYTGVDKTAKRAISLKEIRKIKYLDLSGNTMLEFVRDMFLFSFYTRGMSFVDMAFLRKKDVSAGYLTYSRKKTRQQLIVKWKDEMQSIVDKYDTMNTQYLLPIISVEDGTERRQYLRKMLLINRRLKTLAKMAGIQIPLTMYVARHSWASIARDKNVPINIISKGMGHDSELTTEIYLSSIINDKVDDANEQILKNL